MASDLHFELCQKATKYMTMKGFGVVFDDRFQPHTCYGEKPDSMGFRGGTSCLIEAKVSRADFLVDKNKKFRNNPKLGMGDWRFYICPPNIIAVEDLPEGWGLLYARPKSIMAIRGWPPNTQWITDKPFEGNKAAEMSYMYSALRRMQIRGHLDDVYEGIVKWS